MVNMEKRIKPKKKGGGECNQRSLKNTHPWGVHYPGGGSIRRDTGNEKYSNVFSVDHIVHLECWN